MVSEKGVTAAHSTAVIPPKRKTTQKDTQFEKVKKTSNDLLTPHNQITWSKNCHWSKMLVRKFTMNVNVRDGNFHYSGKGKKNLPGRMKMYCFEVLRGQFLGGYPVIVWECENHRKK